jgi:hypothetical protein
MFRARFLRCMSRCRPPNPAAHAGLHILLFRIRPIRIIVVKTGLSRRGQSGNTVIRFQSIYAIIHGFSFQR